MTTPAELLAASRATVIAQAAELATLREVIATHPPDLTAARQMIAARDEEIATLQRDLVIERARRAHPIEDDALEFITATEPERIVDQVRRLSTLFVRSA